MRRMVKLFRQGSVCVTGEKGSGKDMLTANVIARRKEPYASNFDYTEGKLYHPLKYDDIDLKCDYRALIKGDVPYYKYPYPEKTDIYLSDAGIYFPAQYCNELNRDYKSLAVFMALSRQLSGGGGRFHISCQTLNRLFDKIREQSDRYIRCNWCKVFFGKIVIQKVTIYDRADSCQARIKPCSYSMPLLANREQRQRAKLYFDDFENRNGSIKSRILIYINKSSYDTYFFRSMFENGRRPDEEKK